MRKRELSTTLDKNLDELESQLVLGGNNISDVLNGTSIGIR